MGRSISTYFQRLSGSGFRKLLLIAVALCFLLTLSNPADAKKGFKKGEVLRIQTSKTHLKNHPKPFGAKILETLERGVSVTVLSQKGSWVQVEFNGTKGFIPKKSLIKSKKFKSFSRTAKVTQSDMAAATKGFSPEIEKKNRENKKLRYDLMDQAEKKSTVANPLESLKPFRKEGHLGEFQ